MSKINEFLTEAGVFFLATADGDQPKLRPLGAHMEVDGLEYFGVGSYKDVYQQMQKNPRVEIAACKANGHWLRYTGVAVFDDESMAARMIAGSPTLQNLYNETTGRKLAVFHLEEATAVEIAVMGPGKDLLGADQ